MSIHTNLINNISALRTSLITNEDIINKSFGQSSDYVECLKTVNAWTESEINTEYSTIIAACNNIDSINIDIENLECEVLANDTSYTGDFYS